MTTLGIALIVAGLTLVCGSMIFLLFTRREPSQESSKKIQIASSVTLMRRAENVQQAPPEGTENWAGIGLSSGICAVRQWERNRVWLV
jgi:hypothetical protein